MKQDLLRNLLSPGQLVSCFQPIVRIDRGATDVYGYEALTHGLEGTNFRSAAVLFDYVRRKRMEPVIDRECITLALEQATRLGPDARICLNIHASSIGRDPNLAEYTASIAEYVGRSPATITIEVVEYLAIWSPGALGRGIDRFRNYGMQIAIDDLGCGQSNYRMILECRPNFLKLDGFIVRGCGTDDARRAILQSVAELSRRLGCSVIAEGIESENDLLCARAAGVEFAQGYLFGRPSPVSGLLEQSIHDPFGRADRAVGLESR